MPTSEQIQQIMDQQALHLYVTHIQRFNQYKEALARGASDQEATALLKNAASQQIEDPPAQPTPQDSVDAETAQESTTAETSTDRLRLDRSEERRVGKECRLGWSPQYDKKKEKVEDDTRVVKWGVSSESV